MVSFTAKQDKVLYCIVSTTINFALSYLPHYLEQTAVIMEFTDYHDRGGEKRSGEV